MTTPLRLLLLEDNPSDAELVLHALRRGGYDPIGDRLETEQEYRDHLQRAPEIILADYSMPEFDAPRALAILQECQLEIPFIVISGTIGDERAVQIMQLGATDFVMKDRLGRLGQAVGAALEKQLLRNEKQQAERRLVAQHAVTQALADSPTLTTASSTILHAICQGLAWDFGALWQVDGRENVLRCVDCWCNPLAQVAEFEAITRQSTFASGIGLPGRIWVSGQAVWVADVSQDLNFPRAVEAAHVGLHGGFGFPIILGAETLGIVEFYSREIKQPDAETLKMMMAIGSQLGQYIERKRSDESLRQSNQTLHALIQTTPLAVITLDQRSHVTMWNSAAEEMFGWKEAGVLGQPLPIVPPDQQEAFQRSIHHELRPDKATAHELRLFHKTGSLIDVNLWTAPMTDASDAIVGSLGLFVNVTDHKRLEEQSRRAEEAVRNSEARKDAILRVSLDAIITMDHEGRILSFNPAAERIFGYREKDAIGRSVEQLIPPTLRPRHQEGLAHFLKTGKGPMLDKRVELPGLRANGSEFPAELTITRIPVEGAPQFTGFLRDITERKALEDQYRQSQKMEAVGQLAAGVAHDFNNLLTVILGYSEILLAKLPAADPGREPMGQIRKAAERAAGLTRQLLAFGRKQILSPVVLDLNSLVTELDKMLRRLIGEDVELRTVLQPALGRVKADAGQVEQIIMNLVVNARDAMPTGGRLTIQTHNTALTAVQVRDHAELPPGPYTLLAVSDTGSGMDPATRARIFEPFFTTKEVGKGTGLGLATVFGIVKQSGGFIEVDSAIGSGSTFRAYLPQIREATRLKKSDQGLVKMPKGVETILLVEDEDGLRELAQLVLETSGYKVLSTRNGSEAVQICLKHTGDIHLLFTDVVMPRMSGRQLSELLAPSRPSMKVLFMSGYTDDTMVRHGIQDAATNFLPKPFTTVALAQKVRDVLDGPGTPAANGPASLAAPVAAAGSSSIRSRLK